MQSITRENVVTQKWYYGVEIIEIPVEGCITISAAEVEKSIFNFNPNGEIEDEVTTNDFDVIRVIAIENITTVYEYDQDYSND